MATNQGLVTVEEWTVRLPALPMPELSPNAYLAAANHWTLAKLRDIQRDQWLALLNNADIDLWTIHQEAEE